MIDAKNHLSKKYKLDMSQAFIEIPNTGRDDLAELFKELGYKVGVEIGVLKGEYTEILCKKNPDAKIYGIDPWLIYDKYRDYRDKDEMDLFYDMAKKKLKPYNVELIKKTSMEAVKDFKDDSLDFIYIDGNHEFGFVAEDIHFWRKKVKVGGIISGHDYFEIKKLDSFMHVKYAVDAAVKAYRIKTLFLWGRRWCPPTEKRDNPRSWMFVREW